MKRFISLLFILLALGNAFAESDSSREIFFRGLQWGCSIETVQQHFEQFEGNRTSISITNAYAFDYTSALEDSAFTCYTSFKDDFMVAGHAVDYIRTYAIFGIADGKISQSPSDSKFYHGSYYFSDIVNIEEVYDDLVSKLTLLYGQPQQQDKYSDNKLVWYGDNNTAIEITYDDFIFPSITLDYWDLNIYDEIEDLKQILYLNNLSNTDGL